MQRCHLSLRVTVAWYINDNCRQFPASGPCVFLSAVAGFIRFCVRCVIVVVGFHDLVVSKDKNIEHTISWKILAIKAKPYSTINKSCNLCLLEKYIIIRQPELCTLNKRNELVSSCCHKLKGLLHNACNRTPNTP